MYKSMNTKFWKWNRDIPEYSLHWIVGLTIGTITLSEDQNTVIEKESSINDEELREKGKN